jgi:hypothetical protein
MIQANELRIGNYVLRNDIPGNWYELRAVCKDRIHPIQVVEQDWAKNCFWASDCTLSDLNPIPLEEEILLNFGFEFTGECYNSPSLGRYNIFIYEGEKLEEYRLHFTHNKYVAIYFVHQLQNLFYALTGTELTIKETVLK